ncbi:hypothetical protein B0H34DRAFT_849924 [Crassisporium funariophilum]|nr:hypothetical protein B0H34DRAFT_849924 [Crassisporium funariophilum]
MQPASTNIHIPPEIVELFVDELALQHDHSSKAALRACALVSKGVHDRVACHLFSTINLIQKDGWGVKKMTERLEDLLQLLTNNPGIGPRIRTFSLETKAPHEHLNFDFMNLEMHMLPAILRPLIHLEKLSFRNLQGTVRFSLLGEPLVPVFKELLKSPSLSSLELRNIDAFPLKLLTSCTGLKNICLTNPLMEHDYDDYLDMPKPPSTPLLFPFMLESAVFFDSAPAIEGLLGSCNALSSQVFCRLRHLTVAFHSHKDILTAWGIMLQASESLEVLTISRLTNSNYVNLVENPVDLSLLHALRCVDVIIGTGNGTTTPKALCKLFTTKESASNIELIRFNLNYGGVVAGDEELLFRSDRGWSALDEALTSGKYGALKNVVLKLSLNYQWSTAAIVEAQKATIISYARRMLPMVRASTKLRVWVKMINMTAKE